MLVVVLALASLWLAAIGCSQPAAAPTAAPAAAPTKAPAAPAAAPTAAPAAPTAAPAAAAAPTQPAKPKIDYPTKPIMYIIPWAAGGPMGTGVLIMDSFLGKELGQNMQLVYKAGATGQVGLTEFVGSAKPDGYTLTGLNSPNSESTWLDPERKAVYNRASFVPIALQVLDPNTFSVRGDSPYKTLADVIKAAKEKPESVVTGDGGLMSDDHLALLKLQMLTGAKFAMSHFDGGAPTRTALQGSHINMMVGNIVDAMAGYKDGSFRVLGIAAQERSPLMPDVPTMKEQGIELFAATARGWVAPAGTPAEIVKILEAGMKKVDAMPEYRQKMDVAGLPPRFLGAAEYDQYLQVEEKRVAELLKEVGQK